MRLFTGGARKAPGISKRIPEGRRATKWQSHHLTPDHRATRPLTPDRHLTPDHCATRSFHKSPPPRHPASREPSLPPKPEQTDGQLLLPEAAPPAQEGLTLMKSSLCTARIRELPKFCPPGRLAGAHWQQAPSWALQPQDGQTARRVPAQTGPCSLSQKLLRCSKAAGVLLPLPGLLQRGPPRLPHPDRPGEWRGRPPLSCEHTGGITAPGGMAACLPQAEAPFDIQPGPCH